LKKKKTTKNEKKDSSKEQKKPAIQRDLKKSILAVLLIAFALIFILSLIGKAGIVGGYLDNFLALVFGWGRYLLPFLMILVGVVYFRKTGAWYSHLTSVGAIILFVFLLVFSQSFYELEEMIEVAKDGSGGGYLGLALAYPLVKYLGKAAALIISFTGIIIGLMLTFNITLAKISPWLRSIFEKIKTKFRKNKSEDEDEDDDEDDEVPKKEKTENNIKIQSIKFVEDPNRIADKKEGKSKKQEGILKGKEADLAAEKSDTSLKRAERDLNWTLPPLNILETNGEKAKPGNLEKNAKIIKKTLKDFGIEVDISGYNVGPSVVQYTFRPAIGVKLSRILALQNDLALALAAHSVRIEAPIPGKSLVGVEVPLSSEEKALVRMKSALKSETFKKRSSNLSIVLGEDVNGDMILGNIDKMPHLMIAGATGTGKSVCVNSILVSLLYQNSPDQLKLILVDPKRVELSMYNKIPHLLTPVIVDTSKVVKTLKWAVGEMEGRYKLLQDIGTRDIHSYNKKAHLGKKRQVFDEESGKYHYESLEKIPFIIIVIDELADLMAAHGKEVEGIIVRLAQMARAVGIHLIVSTQRPSVEVLTGIIKANITTRIAFQVATQIDSRTILDMGGAEKLLGNGDSLYLNAESPKPKRVQSIFVSEQEVKRVVGFIKKQTKESDFQSGEELSESLKEELKKSQEMRFSGGRSGGGESEGGDEELLEQARKIVIEAGKASTAYLQRKLRIGYPRAANLMDTLEEQGVIGKQEGAKARDVLIKSGDASYDDPASDQEKRDKWQQ
jgi:DNA segregation ATPase FtsK/SpoIIIE, S-DNA-T family